jgi:hypothetical protein
MPLQPNGRLDEFVDRMLRDRRTLDQALAEIVAKSDRIPRGKERSMLERMIEVLRDEIALRQNPPHIAQ